MENSSFSPAPERLALADSAARMLDERYGANEERCFEAARWREYAELGWLLAAQRESSGGLALPWSTVSVLVETLAPAAAVEPLSAQLALVGPLLDAATPGALRDASLEAWRAGELMLALAHDEQPGAPWQSDAITTLCRRDGEQHVLEGRKALVLDGGLAQRLLISARDEDGQLRLFIVDCAQAGLAFTPRDSMDGRAHGELAFAQVRLEAAAQLHFDEDIAQLLTASAWLHALLLAAESVGLLRAMLRASHEYLIQRSQFGRPLIEFQVLQHRLVDMLLTLTRLESLLELARSRCDEGGPCAAAPAIAALKAACGEEGRALARQAVQLHGALGVTAELALGRQLRRLTALELLAGTTAQHARYWAAHRAALDTP